MQVSGHHRTGQSPSFMAGISSVKGICPCSFLSCDSRGSVPHCNMPFCDQVPCTWQAALGAGEGSLAAVREGDGPGTVVTTTVVVFRPVGQVLERALSAGEGVRERELLGRRSVNEVVLPTILAPPTFVAEAPVDDTASREGFID